MKGLLYGIGVVAAMTVVGPVWAQAPASGMPYAQSAHVHHPTHHRSRHAYHAAHHRYRPRGLTAGDDYRAGLLNRWELEQIEGPLPQAWQGPSPNGIRNGR